ncbi:MAG: hypothetical protein HPY57_13840 [Ignavibacteria bacterium]|nr:hypothetical protein [Ignavibacteria bacterium]
MIKNWDEFINKKEICGENKKLKENILNEQHKEKEKLTNNFYYLTFYIVNLHTDSYIERIYEGINKEDAYYYAKKAKPLTKYYNTIVEICSYTNKYIYVNNYEDVDNYPINNYYDDPKYYKLIEDNEDNKSCEYYTIDGSEKSAEKLMNDVLEWLYKEYGRRKSKYASIYLDEDKTIKLQIRVADHSENPLNKGRYTLSDYYLSIVIANKNETKNRYHSKTELYYTGDDTLDDIKNDVINYIENLKYKENLI